MLVCSQPEGIAVPIGIRCEEYAIGKRWRREEVRRLRRFLVLEQRTPPGYIEDIDGHLGVCDDETRSSQHGADTAATVAEGPHQHILAVGQGLFSSHAYDAIAIEDIAAAAGMSNISSAWIPVVCGSAWATNGIAWSSE
jgi:hypothetical protein